MTVPHAAEPQATLDEVVELFWEKGYHDVCVEDIVHRTGLNRHTLYGNFGSKLGLFRAALAHYLERNVRAIDEALPSRGGAQERITALLALRSNAEHPFWRGVRERGCLAARTADELGREHPELKQPMDDLGRHLLGRVEAIVREGQVAGEIANDRDPADIASIVVSCFMAPLAWSGAHVSPQALSSILS
jgi:TetR/AcrR family transcriptional repressor of nem operon